MNYDDYDLTEAVENYQVTHITSMTHNWKMLLGLFILFLAGGIQALQGVSGWEPWASMLVPILLAAEHLLAGKTE